MGDRNHLHVCRDCGNVVATSSATGPATCFNCSADNFSLFLILPELLVPTEHLRFTWHLYGEYARGSGVREKEVTIEGKEERPVTVLDALHTLVDEHPTLEERVFNSDTELADECVVVHNHMNVYHEHDRLHAKVEPEDELALLPRDWPGAAH